MKFNVIPIFLLIVTHLLTSCNQTNVTKSLISEKPDSEDVALVDNEVIASNTLEIAPVVVSKDYGKSWEPLSGNLPKEVQVSFLEQKDAEIVLASDNMGIFISSANKSIWKPISEDLPGKKINALHIAEGKIYAGVYQQGIYQTGDEGGSWKSLNYNLQNLNVQSILKFNEQLFIGTDEGLFVLPQKAQKWTATAIKSQVLSIYEYDKNIIVGTSQGTLISNDFGKKWDWIRKEGAVHYTHNIGQRIIELQLNGDVVYSDDWGESWKATTYQPRESSYVYEIIAIADYQLISNNYGIHRSSDGGATWQLIYPSESVAFLDLISVDQYVYGGTRIWNEYRKRHFGNY